MEFEWDEAKDAANRAKHGISLGDAQFLDWRKAAPIEDTRKAYGERRFLTFLYMGERLFVCAFTLREGRIRIISLRKANRRERKSHG